MYAAIITGLVFRSTRSFLGATVAGMASFVALQRLLPARSSARREYARFPAPAATALDCPPLHRARTAGQPVFV